ncbi:hypothetical protein Shyhy01_18170 [Streptomyces hygroscopicus subsp. hygroscopicus]|nr:hypothetical protein [Streptomyces hygroscopicus]GLX48867.1 hypothetical protein Shyhy01_18170 [Streptomyces hygroscopicus subsp. hygroscopicus]
MSRTKRACVLSVVDQPITDDEPVTFTGVARAANVSHWLVYAEGVREHIEAARRRQGRAAPNGARTSRREPAGWKLEKPLLQEDNRRLREEVERLKRAVRRSRRQQLDQFGAADLGTRVDELTAENSLRTERDAAPAQAAELTPDTSTRSRTISLVPERACAA